MLFGSEKSSGGIVMFCGMYCPAIFMLIGAFCVKKGEYPAVLGDIPISYCGLVGMNWFIIFRFIC